MQITVSAKQLGRKNALIDRLQIEIEDIGSDPTVRRLIEAVVEQQVRQYNAKPVEKSLLPFLDQASVDTAAAAGKVGFGSLYNEAKADPAESKRVALQAFADGLFVLFAGEQELTDINEKIPLHPSTVITFIRLAFLAGGYW